MSLKEMLAEEESLLNEIAKFETEIEPLHKRLEDLKNAITDKSIEALEPAKAGKDTGTVHFEADGVAIKATIGKSVKWDQKLLAEIRQKIVQAGDDPGDYIITTYGVSENAFQNWPAKVQEVFLPARTLIPGKPKFEYIVNPEDAPF